MQFTQTNCVFTIFHPIFLEMQMLAHTFMKLYYALFTFLVISAYSTKLESFIGQYAWRKKPEVLAKNFLYPGGVLLINGNLGRKWMLWGVTLAHDVLPVNRAARRFSTTSKKFGKSFATVNRQSGLHPHSYSHIDLMTSMSMAFCLRSKNVPL